MITMETMKTKYPKYTPGQYLTSANLNDSLDFVSQQERLTRWKLLGKGIFNGLKYSYDFNGNKVTSINLQAGTGVTDEGFLIDITSDGKFTHCVEFGKMNPSNTYPLGIDNPALSSFPLTGGFRLLNKTDANSEAYQSISSEINLSINDLQSKYTFALYYEIGEIHTSKCSLGDCNTKGDYYTVSIVPMLVNKLNNTPKKLDFQTFLKLSSLREISLISSENGFRKKINDTIASNHLVVKDKLKSIISFSKNFIPENLISEATATISNTNFLNINNNSSFNQYYIRFGRDIRKAVNEYLQFFNETQKWFAPNQSTFYPKLLILGNFPLKSDDGIRNNWVPAKTNNRKQFALNRLNSLFNRIFTLCKYLMNERELLDSLITSGATNLTSRIRITPQRGLSAMLSDSAIGYYYNLAGSVSGHPIYALWDGEPSNEYLDQIYNYWDFSSKSEERKQLENPFSFDWTAMEHFLIEGHIGTKPDEASKVIIAKIQNLGLPAKVVMVDIRNESIVGIREKYQLFLEAYRKFLKELKSVEPTNPIYTGYKKPFEKMSIQLNELSPKDILSVKTVLNDVQSYTTMFASAAKAKRASGDVTTEAIAKVTVDSNVSAKISALMDKYEIGKLRKDIYDILPKGVDTQSQITLDDFVGPEYTGGVPKGGTFIMVHNGSTVIGDFSVPYFFKE